MNAFSKYLLYKKLMAQLDCTSNRVDKKDSPHYANCGTVTWSNSNFPNKTMDYKVTSYREDDKYYTKVNIKDKLAVRFGQILGKKLYQAAYQIAVAQEQSRALDNIMHKLLMMERESR